MEHFDAFRTHLALPTSRSERHVEHRILPPQNEPHRATATIEDFKERRSSDATVDPSNGHYRQPIGAIERAFAFHPTGQPTAEPEVRPSARKIGRFRLFARRGEAKRGVVSAAAITRSVRQQRLLIPFRLTPSRYLPPSRVLSPNGYHPAMIYGHDDQSTEPRLMREVTFQLAPEQLRRVAAFLTARAAEIEAGTFVEGGRHLRDEVGRPLAFDVVVVPPLAG